MEAYAACKQVFMKIFTVWMNHNMFSLRQNSDVILPERNLSRKRLGTKL